MFATLTSCDRGICIDNVQDDASFYTHSSSSTIGCSTVHSEESSLLTAVVTVFENGSVLDDINDEWRASDSTSLSSSSSSSTYSASRRSTSTASFRRRSANRRNKSGKGSGSGGGSGNSGSQNAKMIPITTSGYHRSEGRQGGAGVGIGIGTVISDNLSNSVITVFHGKNRKDKGAGSGSGKNGTTAVVSPMHSRNSSFTDSRNSSRASTNMSSSDEDVDCSGGVEMLRMADDADDSASIILLGQQDDDDTLLLNRSQPIYSWDEIELEKHKRKEMKQIVLMKKLKKLKLRQRKRQPQPSSAPPPQQQQQKQTKQQQTPPPPPPKTQNVNSSVGSNHSVSSRSDDESDSSRKPMMMVVPAHKIGTNSKATTSPVSPNRKSIDPGISMGSTENVITPLGEERAGVRDTRDDDCSSIPSMFMVETSIDEYLKFAQSNDAHDNGRVCMPASKHGSSSALSVQSIPKMQNFDNSISIKRATAADDATAAAEAVATAENMDGMTIVHNIDRKKDDISNTLLNVTIKPAHTSTLNVTIKPAQTTTGHLDDGNQKDEVCKETEEKFVNPSPTAANDTASTTPIDSASADSGKKVDYNVYETSPSYPSFLLSNYNGNTPLNSSSTKMTKSMSTISLSESRQNTAKTPTTTRRVQSSNGRSRDEASKKKSSSLIFTSWVDSDDGDEDMSATSDKHMKKASGSKDGRSHQNVPKAQSSNPIAVKHYQEEGPTSDNSSNDGRNKTTDAPTYRHQFLNTMNWFLCNAGDSIVLSNNETGTDKATASSATEKILPTDADYEAAISQADDEEFLRRLVSF